MIVGRHAGQFFHAPQLALGFFANLVGQIRFRQTLAQLFGFSGLSALAFAQFLLNRLHLLAQHIVLLGLVHFSLRFVGNLRSQPNDLDFVSQKIVR